MRANHSSPRTQQAGFTLIEIMVVVAILAILASVVIPRIMSEPDKARVVKAKQDIRVLESSLELYKLDNFTYPSTDQGLDALVTRPNDASNWKEGGYVKKLPKDPWQREYQYISPGEHGEIDIYSLGADGVPGGDKFAADIGNWDL
ncbi:MAG: type II secretion system major pseudopilin GspG [Gammaproteobacteria bacterium]|nr:type II secretion system major pseudopilin GspG [Gammaproteobacteria bacterium]